MMKRKVAIAGVVWLTVWAGYTVSAQMPAPPGGSLPDEQGSVLVCPGDGRILEWVVKDNRIIEDLSLDPERKQGILKRLFECHRKMIELQATIQKAFVTQTELLGDVVTNETDLIKNVEGLADAHLKLAKLELSELAALRKALSREQYARVQVVYRQHAEARGPAPMWGPAGGPVSPAAGMPGMAPMGSAPMPPPPMPGLMPGSNVGPGAAPGALPPPPPAAPAARPPAAVTGGVLAPSVADPSKKGSPANAR